MSANGLLFESLIIYFDILPELPPESTSQSESKPNQPSIVINQPWYYFYETNKDGRIPYKMTKPTNAQIKEALGTSAAPKSRQDEPEQVQNGAQTQFSSFLPGHSYSDPEAWTAEQVAEATLEALKRKNKQKTPVKVEPQQL